MAKSFKRLQIEIFTETDKKGKDIIEKIKTYAQKLQKEELEHMKGESISASETTVPYEMVER